MAEHKIITFFFFKPLPIPGHRPPASSPRDSFLHNREASSTHNHVVLPTICPGTNFPPKKDENIVNLGPDPRSPEAGGGNALRPGTDPESGSSASPAPRLGRQRLPHRAEPAPALSAEGHTGDPPPARHVPGPLPHRRGVPLLLLLVVVARLPFGQLAGGQAPPLEEGTAHAP